MAKKLDDLPASDDPYFTKYEADTFKVKMPKPPKCKHFFEQMGGKEAECKECGVGLFLERGDSVKGGHIYKGKKLVI
jgi:hypothetical protein